MALDIIKHTFTPDLLNIHIYIHIMRALCRVFLYM